MRFLILFLLALCMKNVYAEGALIPPLKCGDFLKQIGLHRADVKFVSCEEVSEAEIGPGGALRAEYHVKGKDVANVENWLVHIAPGIKRLRFNCCGWETTTGAIVGRHGDSYQIIMGSGETTIDKREDIPRIPFMHITVTHYLQEP